MPGDKKRSHLLRLLMEALTEIFQATPRLGEAHASRYRWIDFETRERLTAPPRDDAVLVLDAAGFPPEGDGCDARFLCRAFELGLEAIPHLRLQGPAFPRLRLRGRHR